MHGVGGAQDLPIPAAYAIIGASVAVMVSFVVLVVAWREPRFDGATAGTPVGSRLTSIIESSWLAAAARTVGMLIFAYIVWISIWGPDLVINPVFGIVYVLLWGSASTS